MGNAFSPYQNEYDYQEYLKNVKKLKCDYREYKSNTGLKIIIGSGRTCIPGWKTMDIDKSVRPDIVADANGSWPFKDGSVSQIKMDCVIEHLKDINHVFKEAYRVLDREGTLEITTCNFFFWRTRIQFLLGTFHNSSAFSVWHSWLFKPSQLQVIATSHDFDAVIKGKGILPYPNLFYYNFLLTCRKRG